MDQERELTSVLGGVLHICGQADAPLTATFHYLLDDPAALTVNFESANEQAWRFSRDLVRDALRYPRREHGLGDVRTAYLDEQGVFRFALLGIDGECQVYLDAQAVADFLVDTYAAVPLGAERIDVDAWLEELS